VLDTLNRQCHLGINAMRFIAPTRFVVPAFMRACLCIRLIPLVSILLLFAAPTAEGDEEVHIKYLEPRSDWGSSAAVIVGPAALVHTEQVWSRSTDSPILGETASEQMAGALGALEVALRPAGSGLDRIVKLNVYVTGPDAADAARQALARQYSGDARPAVSYVTTRLPDPRMLVALDAVAVSDHDGVNVALYDDRLEPDLQGQAYAAILPVGGRVYIAGQAEPGDLAEATRKTLESLRQTLKFQKLDLSHVVQLKSFLTPMADAAVVRREMRSFFGDRPVPPLVFVEWESTLPIEIELIAAAPKGDVDGGIEYGTPPGMDASPVFSRLARTDSTPTIYIAGLYGPANADGTAQVRDIFSQLEKLLAAAGSDLRHLAKATYYVTDEEASAALNKLRPAYYDPQRPPAASKALVSGVGLPGRTVTLDMIAVPAR
jgi:enamine deaminase RidA (YjgF/YER057c/UK114 family)